MRRGDAATHIDTNILPVLSWLFGRRLAAVFRCLFTPQFSRSEPVNVFTYLQDNLVTSQAVLVECTTYVDTEWLLSLLKATEPLYRR